jgi:Ser/Thr protein kinase RdoA (MazF antagonist)
LEDKALETAEFSNLLRQQISWIQRLSRSDRTFSLTHADLQISNIHVIDSGLPSLAFFDLDDCCFHYFVHDLAVACTQLRKAGIETAGAVDAASLEEHLITCYASARGFSAEEEAGLRASLLEFVKYRAALVMCWASEERKRGSLSGPASEAWFTGSLPIYRQLVRLSSLSGSGGDPLAPQDSRHGLR